MLALHARYRGRETDRAAIVARSAQALATLPGVSPFEVLGVEDIRTTITTPEALTNLTMALLSDGGWAVGIGIAVPSQARTAASAAVSRRAGQVRVRGAAGAEYVEAAFVLLSQVLAKRTYEGREATSLVRRGLNQNEAAEELGISKQAMSQRLQAAGWAAEQAGWRLAVHLIGAADSARG
ncbi:DNA-binding protein [Corynebacterium uterequi]|uniref:DNA-binding protein n=1 Tax=Corynebacterium uterequi TaxID=1072256 RepID=A0A0G3HCI4_9CORY|nr:DNA-binding protein [Corynebacterium uterequi]AKK11106.1 hypothetical protein CUTER_05550 [Corynebacterium uterequi]